MPCRGRLIAGILTLALAALPRPAAAENGEVRLARPLDLAALPLLVAEHNQLVQKAAAARNLGAVVVHWQVPGRADPLDALADGSVDVAAVPDLGLFAAAWDHDPASLRALTALARMPYYLVSRNPAIKTIRDFTAKDRIAVPAPQLSAPALLLEMAAAREWGAEHYDKLDPLLVARADAEAAAALHQAKADITAHVSRLPFVDDELGDQAIHRVMDSFEIAGPHSLGAVVTTARYRDANPAMCAAIAAALADADAFIRQSPGAAAEIYVATARTQNFAVEELSDMLGDPDIGYATAPAGLQRLTDFMAAAGRLQHRPQSWKDLFFPDIYGQSGS